MPQRDNKEKLQHLIIAHDESTGVYTVELLAAQPFSHLAQRDADEWHGK